MKERDVWKINGFLALFIALLCMLLTVYFVIQAQPVLAVLSLLIAFIISTSITIVQPNQARVITFFGRYLGSIRDNGIWMTVPLSSRSVVSLRVSNFNSKTLKVNDVAGNPVEIAAVVVFRVIDSARARFDVSNYEQFVEIQSETALRHVATKYPYDNYEEAGFSLRGNAEEVAAELTRELQERLVLAGVEVMEARLTHLAYATEIASAMLQRQQAAAILAARQIIVEGAVGMVQLALDRMEKDGILELDQERRAGMINNLLAVIISERGAQPIINSGTLY